MKLHTFIIVIVAATAVGSALAAEEVKRPQNPNFPIHSQYQTYLENNFDHFELKHLDDDEQAAFFEVYRPDPDAQKKLEVEHAIRGEAPPFAEAKKNFPALYPYFGRMQNIRGTLLWEEEQQGKSGLVFQTETQRYYVEEYFLLERLQRAGIKNKSQPRQATLNACWTFDQLHGLTLVYLEKLDIH
jgi:hypothetical protein